MVEIVMYNPWLCSNCLNYCTMMLSCHDALYDRQMIYHLQPVLYSSLLRGGTTWEITGCTNTCKSGKV